MSRLSVADVYPIGTWMAGKPEAGEKNVTVIAMRRVQITYEPRRIAPRRIDKRVELELLTRD
jgi:hypothetical protein